MFLGAIKLKAKNITLSNKQSTYHYISINYEFSPTNF